jgi:hypothetical protein
MAISARQRCHYTKLTQQETARTSVIGALVRLSQFPDESGAAIRCLRLLHASSAEVDAATNELMGQMDSSVASMGVRADCTSNQMATSCDGDTPGGV